MEYGFQIRNPVSAQKLLFGRKQMLQLMLVEELRYLFKDGGTFLQGAKEYILNFTGRNVSKTTIYRCLLPAHSNTAEAKRHSNVIIHMRPMKPRC